MIFAIVKVLPEPVTPFNVWYLFPDLTPSARAAIASLWSPAGLNGDTTSNFRIKLNNHNRVGVSRRKKDVTIGCAQMFVQPTVFKLSIDKYSGSLHKICLFLLYIVI
jgi:hypothetical protein